MRILITLLCLLSFSAFADVKVVTSIHPIYQITSNIMRGAGEPELLIKNQASAHHFSFKPSHFVLIKDADLIVWIGRNFESGFRQMPDILSKKTKSIELLRALDMEGEDGHIWYSLELLPKVVNQIQQSLSEIDPANAPIYKRNAEQLIDTIQKWGQTTKAMITNVKPKYVLDHEFLHYFEEDMGIHASAVLHDDHDQHSGIHEIQEIESTLQKSSVKCLLINESSPSKLGRNFADKFDLKIYNVIQSEDQNQQSSAFIDSLNRLSSIMQNCH